MAKIKGKWTKIASSSSIQRSSSIVGVLDNKLLIYGGELKPRQPVDNKVYAVPLSSKSATVEALETSPDADAPTPRVGSASATVGDSLYIFSGRGGPSMKPLDEAGGLWCFSSESSSDSQDLDPNASAPGPSWSLIRPTTSLSASPPASRDGGKPSGGLASYAWPDPRSYHAMTSDGRWTVYLHAGCPAIGRLSDLWAFQLHASRWIRLADAPSPPRGGTSIAFAHKPGETCGKLYRMNGFDGKTEQGSAIDVYDLETDHWSSIKFKADGIEGPEPRSVGSLLSATVAGNESLVTFGGERSPSSLGHEGAGKMYADAWIWDLNRREWSQVEFDGEKPCARGWFASDVIIGADGKDAIVVQGGLDEQNQRLDDLWILTF